MTAEEARLTLMLEYCPQRCDGSKPCRDEDCELYHAIKALGKQVAQKAVKCEYDPHRSFRKTRTLCPSYNKDVYFERDFCQNCGQALDWSCET